MAVLPIYGLLVLPDSTFVYRTELYKNLTGKEPVVDERVVVIVARRETKLGELSNENVYPLGVSGYIKEVNAQGLMQIRLVQRVHVDDIAIQPERKLVITTSRCPDIEDLDEIQAKERAVRVKEELLSMAKDFEWGPLLEAFARSWRNLGDIGAALSPWMNIPNERFYALLAEDSQRARFDALEAMIFEYVELTRARVKVQSEEKENLRNMQREQALRKQIEYLQKELDELHPEEVSGIRKLEMKIEDAGMNELARKEADKVVGRLKSEGPHSAEVGLLTDYLEFLTSLPWKKAKPKDIDLAEAEKILDADHFALEKVKRRILEQLAVMQLRKRQAGSILVFVGAPGTGKTSIGQSIARALGREYVRVSLGGVRDEADIRGHRRTYIGAMPGRILDGIHKCGVSNPVMVLDEVDKLSVSYNGDPASALLEVLDPEQNSNFTDHYLNVPFDLSDVLFICTANSLDTIPEPLLNRMEVIRFQGYTPIEKQEIAVRHLLPKAREEAGLREGDLSLPSAMISEIIEEYTREAGVRGLKKRLDGICRGAAVKLVRGEEPPVEVTNENLRELLDMAPVRKKLVKESSSPGVVTGLAWTSAGGDVLFIETRQMPGGGKLLITGQLGDVMKESVQIALSLVRTLLPEKTGDLEKVDLHVHVPDGATPKDGPSAGITISTALASLFSGVPVSPSVAMTGEVSLQGEVNPIGGLPEKLMAAQRSGVKQVFIPKENVDDLKDVAGEVLSQLEIVPVKTVAEVLEKLDITISDNQKTGT